VSWRCVYDNIYYISGWWCNNHLEKYEFVNEKDDIPYMKWKIKFMFQTTNQIYIPRVLSIYPDSAGLGKCPK